MEDLIVTKNELVSMFDSGELKDTSDGWSLNGLLIEIIAIHDTEPKYIQNITNAQNYKLIFKQN